MPLYEAFKLDFNVKLLNSGPRNSSQEAVNCITSKATETQEGEHYFPSASCDFLLGVFCDLEDVGCMFIRSFSSFTTNYTALYPRRPPLREVHIFEVYP
jgi:hypothetical protein